MNTEKAAKASSGCLIELLSTMFAVACVVIATLSHIALTKHLMPNSIIFSLLSIGWSCVTFVVCLYGVIIWNFMAFLPKLFRRKLREAMLSEHEALSRGHLPGGFVIIALSVLSFMSWAALIFFWTTQPAQLIFGSHLALGLGFGVPLYLVARYGKLPNFLV